MLIVLHEFGHFAAAKAVGMRVERFALFFPPLLAKVRRGETEYGIGAIPLGRLREDHRDEPAEEPIAPEVEHRAYYRQPVWKRIVVISAGPAMNLLIAFAILTGLYLVNGKAVGTHVVASVERGQPASGVLRPGDQIVAIDGKRRAASTAIAQRRSAPHRCLGHSQTDGCSAARPVRVVVRREGRPVTRAITPRYDAAAQRRRIGFAFETHERAGRAGRGGVAQRHRDVASHEAHPAGDRADLRPPRSARRSRASWRPTR